MLFYLSGSIEYASDQGKSWRQALTPSILTLGHHVYDPAADEQKNLTEEEVRDFRSWKTTAEERFRGVIRKIIAWDLDWVEKYSDCVIALWDEAAQRGAGTAAEITVAHRRGIPVYLVCGMPREQISGWILGCATEIFSNFDELKTFIRQHHTAPAAINEHRASCMGTR
ncbi:MAG TPA: hypothetical protein VD837_18635 [Terriglobales bacterium]|nr:hypothetical protein [Terriglobales bacterium]